MEVTSAGIVPPFLVTLLQTTVHTFGHRPVPSSAPRCLRFINLSYVPHVSAGLVLVYSNIHAPRCKGKADVPKSLRRRGPDHVVKLDVLDLISVSKRTTR